jgi:hypothetical protein
MSRPVVSDSALCANGSNAACRHRHCPQHSPTSMATITIEQNPLYNMTTENSIVNHRTTGFIWSKRKTFKNVRFDSETRYRVTSVNAYRLIVKKTVDLISGCVTDVNNPDEWRPLPLYCTGVRGQNYEITGQFSVRANLVFAPDPTAM